MQFTTLSLAINIPGPVALARLVALGGSAVKIEPPGGDPLAAVSPAWYAALHAGIDVRRRDLKTPAARAELETLLTKSDLLLTAMRPAALARLRLDRPALAARHPNLCQLAIFGHEPPAAGVAGHDLTYQAALGLLTPPALPRTLLADLAGAERAVSAALALLLARTQGEPAGYAVVALTTAAAAFSLPWHHGLTRPDGPLGGDLPGYNLYQTADGWVALAALEPHFWRRFLEVNGLEAGAGHGELAARFATQPTAYWTAMARQHDLPLVALPA